MEVITAGVFRFAGSSIWDGEGSGFAIKESMVALLLIGTLA